MHCGDFELLLHTFCAICIISNDINSISISHELVFYYFRNEICDLESAFKGKDLKHKKLRKGLEEEVMNFKKPGVTVEKFGTQLQ